MFTRALKYAVVAVSAAILNITVLASVLTLTRTENQQSLIAAVFAGMLTAQIVAAIFNFTACRWWVWGDRFQGSANTTGVAAIKWTAVHLIVFGMETSVLLLGVWCFSNPNAPISFAVLNGIRLVGFVVFTCVAFTVNNTLVFCSHNTSNAA